MGRSGAVLFEPGLRSGAEAPRTPETEKDTRPGGPLRVSAAPLPWQREKEPRTHKAFCSTVADASLRPPASFGPFPQDGKGHEIPVLKNLVSLIGWQVNNQLVLLCFSLDSYARKYIFL